VYRITHSGVGPKSVRSQKTISNVEVNGKSVGIDRDDRFFTWVCVSDNGIAYQHIGTFDDGGDTHLP